MFRSMFVGGRITAAYMTTGQTQAQMHPVRSYLFTFFAAFCFSFYSKIYLFKMAATLHQIVYNNRYSVFNSDSNSELIMYGDDD